MKLILALAVISAFGSCARAEDYVFETHDARLVIRPDAIVSSLTAKPGGRELLRSGDQAFAAIRKGGRLIPASAVQQHGDLLHVMFGTSGVDADYRITVQPEYLVVELAALHGDGVEEIRLIQLAVSMPNAGAELGVRWDNEFALCPISLSEEVDTRLAGRGMLRASVYPAFSMQGQRVAFVAVPTPRFLNVVQKVEHDFHLPSPTLGGMWAKSSEDVRTSYLFADMTEANADEMIRYAKEAGFRYILIYSSTWSASLGSYPINTRNFPRGEESLKALIDKCHAAGLKVGMHMLTSFVGKNDPLVTPEPSPGLLKDAQTTLAEDMSKDATHVPTKLTTPSALAGFPVEADASYGPASDILIDDEIIHYGQIDGVNLTQCVRGFAGTKAATHKAGAEIYHLAERAGSYLADLRTSLKDTISNRVAGLINRCGFDMIYFDGGEVNDANGPAWYWTAPQQMQIWEKSKRELLVQGSGMTDWTWHIFSRGTSDDYSAVAPKEFLDYHKIPDRWKSYHGDFLPAELGWTGFLRDAPDHTATTPDEVEYYAVRMLALDSAVSLETTLDALRANGRTEEMLKLLGQYEHLRLDGTVPMATRQRLASGEWHMTKPGEFHPIRYDDKAAAVPGELTLMNTFPAQPLRFRLRAAPTLASVGDAANISLLRSEMPIELPPPIDLAKLPGSLIQHYDFPKPLDLSKHRAMAVRIDVDGLVAGTGEVPVLNVQIEAAGFFRDYYIDLNTSGSRTAIMAEPGTKRMLAEFRPLPANYPFKAAMYSFNYGGVDGLNLRWMRYPKGSTIRCRISLVEALQERDTTLKDIEISAGASNIVIPATLKTGDYAEYWADGTIRIFDPNGVTLSTVPVKSVPQLATGANKLTMRAAGPGNVVLTAITLGN
ncbi:MAG TPA: hypothetical protein VHY84_11700 [Bryobacteraceae bacterium]|jgi:hypothetical protein|nr:hypothetical protein [Bryobacteraceae bacterium]